MSKIVDLGSDGGGGLDLGAWLEATTTGQPGAVPFGVNITSANSAQTLALTGARWLLLGRNTSNYPFAVIVDSVPDAGTPETIISSAVTIDFVVRCKLNTNRFFAIINNDVYLLDCGSSGLTLTVTNIASDAGDVGKGEALTNDSAILVAEDDSHFVICNEFDNAGTRSFVSALFTVTYTGTPAATYVTRDVDATGSTGAFEGTFSGDSSVAGTGFYCGLNTVEATSLRFNKITYTSSTVANTVTTVTGLTTIGGGEYTKFASTAFPLNDVCIVAYDGSSVGQTIAVSYASTPTRIPSTSSQTGTGFLDVDQTAGRLSSTGFTAVYGQPATGSTAVELTFCTPFNTNNIYTKSAILLTGFTSVSCLAAAFSLDGNYVCVLGKVGTDTGQAFVMKNVNA